MLFREKLVWEIKIWNQKDEIVILMVDANEDLNKEKFARSLAQLGMRYLVN